MSNVDSEDEEEYVPEWYAYEGRMTIGDLGPEGGYILRDEEFGDPEDDEDSDARITLEQGRAARPGFYVTSTLYGWMFVTHRSETEADATTVYDGARSELTRLVGMIPYEEDRDIPAKAQALSEAIAVYEAKFGS